MRLFCFILVFNLFACCPYTLTINNYSINFIWINRSLDEAQQYIFPAQDQRSLFRDFLNNIFVWAEKNKNGIINIWFDGELTAASAIIRTQSVIEDYSKEHPEIAIINLKDVRTFPEVINDPEVFSDKTPVYFRADLLRAIAALYSFSAVGFTYFVYADLDMEPLSKEELFDSETERNLSEHGIVMAGDEKLGYENGFMIISNHKPNLLVALKWALIDLNIARAHNALKGEFASVTGSERRSPLQALQQVVYDSYKGMIKYFWFLEGRVNLILPTGGPFDKDKYGFRLFGLNRLADFIEIDFLPPYDKEEKYRVLFPARVMIPIKRVKLPPASHHYD